MSDLLHKYARVIGLALLLVAPFGLLYASIKVPTRDEPVARLIVFVQQPVAAVVARVTGALLDVWDGYVALLDVRSENEALRAELATARLKAAQVDELAAQNERLRKLAEMGGRLDATGWLSARVTGVDISPATRLVRIDRGEGDGLRRFMPVVSERGLVGRIHRVYAGASDVLLIDDPRSAVPARVARTRTPVTIRGTGLASLDIAHLEVTESVEVGDAVVTAAVGGVLPAGLPIGRVERVTRQQNALFAEARLRPDADLKRLEEVVVVTGARGEDDLFDLPEVFRLSGATGGELLRGDPDAAPQRGVERQPGAAEFAP